MKLWGMILGLVAGFAVAGGLALATAGGSSTEPPRTRVEVKGPCDEAEHANDPGCGGPQVPEDDERTDERGDDVSGPCDEAEHANDPRCTGTGARKDDDRSGRSASSGPSASSDSSGSYGRSADSGRGEDGEDRGHGGSGSGGSGSGSGSGGGGGTSGGRN